MKFHSMKLQLVLHMKCRCSPGQTDTASGFGCVSTILFPNSVKYIEIRYSASTSLYHSVNNCAHQKVRHCTSNFVLVEL